MKTSIFLLVALSVIVLCMTDGRVWKFQNQHIISEIPRGGCDFLIANRNIRDNNGNCKRENTFIISNFNQVGKVCDRRNRINVNRNLYESPRNMRVLYCKLLGQTINTHCKYKQIQMRKHIVIACDKIKGFLQPVHFQAVGLLTASLLI
uniref:Ribonuclease A-domain domain-containing protein n=1 Tax=Astatotilapia calliptera TaxID=8154 RepID=A0A3P8RGQ7_ASTCA